MGDKIREDRLRRMAKRQRLFLVKSRRRDPRAPDFGMYMLVDRGPPDSADPSPKFGHDRLGMPAATLDQIEAYLNR